MPARRPTRCRPRLVDPDKTFFGTKLITTGIVYNTNLVKAPPKSWKDLLARDAAAKTIMPHPLYSGAAVIHLGTMVQQPDFGWAYYETLAKNGAIAGKGNGSVIEAVARGEKAYGIIIEYMALNAKEKGSPVNFVFPEEGVSAISQPVGILKTTRQSGSGQGLRRLAALGGGAAPVGGPGLFPDLRQHRGAQRISAGVLAQAAAGRRQGDAGAGRGQQEEVHGALWWLTPPRQARRRASCRNVQVRS